MLTMIKKIMTYIEIVRVYQNILTPDEYEHEIDAEIFNEIIRKAIDDAMNYGKSDDDIKLNLNERFADWFNQTTISKIIGEFVLEMDDPESIKFKHYKHNDTILLESIAEFEYTLKRTIIYEICDNIVCEITPNFIWDRIWDIVESDLNYILENGMNENEFAFRELFSGKIDNEAEVYIYKNRTEFNEYEYNRVDLISIRNDKYYVEISDVNSYDSEGCKRTSNIAENYGETLEDIMVFLEDYTGYTLCFDELTCIKDTAAHKVYVG